MIVYYEAHKLPEFGFIHGDISIENIVVPIEGRVLTRDLTHTDRSGTLIDWKLCFNAEGPSNRALRSGTPAFMAPVLLDEEQILQRTLGHDMESFFAVVIWIATPNYADEAAFQAKPLGLRRDGQMLNDTVAKILAWGETPRKPLEIKVGQR
jgi:hypothetical protein